MALPVPTPANRESPLQTVVETLFHTDRSKAAATLFLARFTSKEGRMTEVEMARFVKELKSGELGAKLSKGDFHERVLKAFLEHGLIRLCDGYDSAWRKTVPTYLVVWQHAPQRAPSKPSLLYNAHALGRAWNQIFSDGADAGS